MSDALDEFDLDPQLGTPLKSGGEVQPMSTPSIVVSFITRQTIKRTITATTACGSTPTTGRC